MHSPSRLHGEEGPRPYFGRRPAFQVQEHLSLLPGFRLSPSYSSAVCGAALASWNHHHSGLLQASCCLPRHRQARIPSHHRPQRLLASPVRPRTLQLQRCRPLPSSHLLCSAEAQVLQRAFLPGADLQELLPLAVLPQDRVQGLREELPSLPSFYEALRVNFLHQ